MSLKSLTSPIVLAALGFFAASALHAKVGGTVSYNPVIKYAQGNQPFSGSYVLQVQSPANLPSNTSTTITLNLSLLASPAGVTAATALSFVTLSSPTLTFTGPNQTLTTTVSVNVPLGTYSGDYIWHLQPSGWPSNLTITDAGATINGTFIAPAASNTSPPTITLQSPANLSAYTYDPTVGTPVNVPVQFEAVVGTSGAPVSAMSATITSGGTSTPITLNIANLNTIDATAAGSVSLTAAGTYVITCNASNANGAAPPATTTITVAIAAPPPTVTITTAPSANYTFTYGGAPLTIPFAYTASSSYGNLTAVSATLNGSAVAVNFPNLPVASGTSTGTLTITAPGTYTLVCSATNPYGSGTQTATFTVNGVVPSPTVTITAPANSSSYTLTAGGPALQIPYTYTGGTSYGTIVSSTATLNGVAITPTLSGLNTAAVTGTGTLSITAAGTYTLVANVSNSGATASTSTTFTVVQQAPPVTENLIWLPPISLGKTIQGGSTMPIKFTLLDSSGNFIRDTADVVVISEVYANGTTSTPVIYPYGAKNNSGNYVINGNHYQLNFPTARGAHHYVIEVYHPLDNSGSNLQLLGSKDLYTTKQSCDSGDEDDNHHGSCHNGDQGDDGHYQDDGNHSGNCWQGGGDDDGGQGSWGNGDDNNDGWHGGNGSGDDHGDGD